MAVRPTMPRDKRQHRGSRRRGGCRRRSRGERDGRVGLSADRHDRPGRSRGRGRPDDRAVLRPESIACGHRGGSVPPTRRRADGEWPANHHGSDARRERTEPRAEPGADNTASHGRWHDAHEPTDANQPTDLGSTRGRSRRPWRRRRRHGRWRYGRKRHAQRTRRGRGLERPAQSARRRARSQGFRVGGTEPARRPPRTRGRRGWWARSERTPCRWSHAARRPPGTPRAHAQTVTAIRIRRRVR